MTVNSQTDQVRAALAKVLRDASGFELDELNPNGTFLELGFDSLFLIQFSQRIKSALGVKVTFRQLIEEVPTIDQLLVYLEKNGKWQAASHNSSTATTTAATTTGDPAHASSNVTSPEPATEDVTSSLPETASGDATQKVVAPPAPNCQSQPTEPPGNQRLSSAVKPAVAKSIQAVLPSAPTVPTSTVPASTVPASTGSVPTGLVLSGSAIYGLPPTELTTNSTVGCAAPVTAGSLERIILQQNQLMSQQLQLLRERRFMSNQATVSAPVVGSTEQAADASVINTVEPESGCVRETVPPPAQSKQPAPPPSQAKEPSSMAASGATGQKKMFDRFGPYKPVRRSDTGGLTDAQRQHLSEFIERFTRRTRRSRDHAQKHRDHFADPRGVAGYRRIWKSMVYQITVERSSGSRLWDIDENEYIDIAMGFGLNLFGQSPAFVTKALHEQLERGVEVGPQSPLAGEVAKLLCEFSRMDRATFCNTGSEAVMAAMRLARTVTGKTKCVFFNKDYHGNFDQVLLRSGSMAGKPCSSPAAPGVPQFYADNTIVLEYGTEEALRQLEQHAGEIAAVLVEPVQSADPDLHPKEFLQKLRQLTRDHQIAMVMDEVISGFRAAPGGAQEYFDVWGDMATYGKILGGGLPIGALAGKSEYMDALDGGTWKYEDSSEPEADMTFFAGTFVRHPLAMTAAYQILSQVKSQGPTLQESLNRKTARLTDDLNDFFVSERIPIRVARFTSLFRFIFPPDLEFADMLYFHLLDRGIFTRGWGDNCFLSTEHSDTDVQRIVEAVKDSCLELRRAGFLPGGDDGPNNGQPMRHANRSAESPAAQPLDDSPARIECSASIPGLRLHQEPFRVSTIDEIQPGGEMPPLFCMPAADGLTLVYHELSDCLGPNQPVYGLNSPGVYGEPVPKTIEEMAERFVADILEVWPDGPFLLAGYCSGGTIALEVAQQLIARGKTVAFLAGVETYNWCTAQSSRLTPWIRLVYQIQRLDFHFRNFLLLEGSQKWKFLKSKLRATQVRTRVWRGMIKNLFSRSSNTTRKSGAVNQADIWRQHDVMADRYHPQVYPGKIYLFRPKKDYSSYVAKEELRAEQGVEVIRMPVYPAGSMVSPYVSQLAEMIECGIRDGLAEVDWQHSDSDQTSPDSNSNLQLHAAV